MPDAPIATPAAAPSAPAGGGNAAPQITFGGSASSATPKAPASTPTPSPDIAPKPAEAESPFEFKFDGDEETYREKPSEAAQPEERYDASKPFDPELREILKANPEKLKQVERNHFELRQWQQKSGFKNVQEAQRHQQEISSLVQSLGRSDGLKGLDAIKAEASEWATTMQGFQSGDPAVIDQWFTDNPEGMTKLMGPAIAKFADANPAAYAHEMSKIMAATLNSMGESGFSALQAYNFLVDKLGKDPENAKWLNVIGGMFNSIYSAAKNAPTPTQANSPQLEAREKALQASEAKIYQQSVLNTALPVRSKAINQAIDHAFRGMTLSADARADVERNMIQRLLEAQRKDETYRNNSGALLQAKDTDGFLRAYKSSVSRLLPDIARKMARAYSGITAADRRAEGQSRTEAGGAVNQGTTQKQPYAGQLVNGGPPPAIIDYQAMRAKYGREGTSDMLARKEFLQKGKGSTIFQW